MVITRSIIGFVTADWLGTSLVVVSHLKISSFVFGTTQEHHPSLLCQHEMSGALRERAAVTGGP